MSGAAAAVDQPHQHENNNNSDNDGVAYIGHYPVAAFVVRDKASLSALVARLRALGRLKSGRNVTAFYPDYVRLVQRACNTPQPRAGQAGQLAVHEVSLRDEGNCEDDHDDDNGAQAVTCLDAAHMYMMCDANNADMAEQQAQLKQHMQSTWRSSSSTPSYMAVHVTGQWSEDELRAVWYTADNANSNMDTTQTTSFSLLSLPPLCFITPLRVYDRACCTLVDLPRELALLRHIAHTSAEECEQQQTPAASSSFSFTFAELFAGIGMFRRGLERVGGEAVWAVEWAAAARRVYKANYLDHVPTVSEPRTALHSTENDSAVSTPARVCPLLGDVTEIPTHFFASHDLLTAGFPCQSFAKASACGAGLKDRKGWLFYEVGRVLRAARPRAFVLENVEHLTSLEEGAQLREILRCLRHPHNVCSHTSNTCCSAQTLSYAVLHRVLDGALASPQRRRRVYFIGIRTDLLTGVSQGGTVLSGVFDAAVAALMQQQQQQQQQGSLTSEESTPRYRTVREVLLENAAPPLRLLWLSSLRHSSADDQTQPQEQHNSSSGEIVRQGTQDAKSVQRTLAQARLTSVQWEAVRRSRSFRHNPRWRVTRLDGCARTLLGSYRNSYQLYSEFVPLPSTRAVDDLVAECCASDPTRRKKDDEETENGDDDEACLPPLRFFTPRECARLQGIDDGFDLLLPDEHNKWAADNAQASCPLSGEAYRLVGNAVNPRVIAALGQALMQHVNAIV